jgi:hypothetical protein
VKYLILFVLAVALLGSIPCEVLAGCGLGGCGLGSRIGAVRSNSQARRSEGRGIVRLRFWRR